MAAFLAQCAHESGEFTALKENLNYKAVTLRKIFPKYFPTDEIANQYAGMPNKQQAIANKVYANRMGNGDYKSGDGWKYRGRGALQLTGKHNYQDFADHLNNPEIMKDPDLVATEYAFESAMFFFEKNKLWEICDRGVDDTTITVLTKRINGGTQGLEDRKEKTIKYRGYV
jgi:putative chitinase